MEVAVNTTRAREQSQGSAPSPEAWFQDPFTAHIKLDGSSSVPSPFRTPGTFSITRLESPAGLHDRITKISSVPALLVSICLKSLPLHSYQVWAAGKLVPTHRSFLRFRSNVIDFDSEPSCWAGEAFDYVHYTLPRAELDDIAADFGFGRVNNYRLSFVEDDLVLAQITRSILPFIGQSDGPSLLALDQFSLILGAHLRRAEELLSENLDGRVRLREVARECALSVSHFARSFKAAFGVSTHQWLIRRRIEHAQGLLRQTTTSIADIAIQSGFGDQAAFTRTFHRIIGVSPGRWRRYHRVRGIGPNDPA